MKKKYFTTTLLLMLLTPLAAHAQLAFTIVPAVQITESGTTLTYTAQLTNIGGPTLFLNGDAFSFVSDNLVIDDSKFFGNAPLSLAGDEAWEGEIFDIAISPDAPPGTYSGSFTVVGGFDSNATDDLAAASFSTIVSPNTSVPETDPFVVLSIGVVGLSFLVIRASNKTSLFGKVMRHQLRLKSRVSGAWKTFVEG